MESPMIIAPNFAEIKKNVRLSPIAILFAIGFKSWYNVYIKRPYFMVIFLLNSFPEIRYIPMLKSKGPLN